MKIALLMLALFSAIVVGIWCDSQYLLFGSNSGLLQHYRLLAGPQPIGEAAGQSSGLTFDAEHNRLFAIVNRPPRIYELQPDGTPVRSIKLNGFDDTEGIVYLGDNQFAVVSERKATVSWFAIDADTQEIDYLAVYSLPVGPYPPNNRGLEGVAYDPDHKRLFVVKERSPRKVYEIAWPPPPTGPADVHEPWDAERQPWWGLQNLSDIYYQRDKQHLFVLSRRSKAVVEFTLDGREVGRLYLKGGSAGLSRAIGKPEGLTIAPDGTLYVCGEPNELYIFTPAAAK